MSQAVSEDKIVIYSLLELCRDELNKSLSHAVPPAHSQIHHSHNLTAKRHGGSFLPDPAIDRLVVGYSRFCEISIDFLVDCVEISCLFSPRPDSIISYRNPDFMNIFLREAKRILIKADLLQ